MGHLLQLFRLFRGFIVIDRSDVGQMQIARQISHWTMATSRLGNLEDLASPSAWEGLERYVGVVLRRNLSAAVSQLQRQATALQTQWKSAKNKTDRRQVRRQLVAFRRRYLRTETLLDFYADAINTRTSSDIAALLRACDTMARQSMIQILEPLGKPTPPVLTYVDKGLGASILKAGLRLWDGSTESMTAAIKIVRHNLYRPTALIHEAGHQVAHILGWNDELAAALAQGLTQHSGEVAEVWASWASEIAADTFAFVHTGYAAVAGLHDVLAGGSPFVFRYGLGDPHPISYIRVLLGTEMCRRFFGAGPWDNLALSWRRTHPLKKAKPGVRRLLQQSVRVLPAVVEICLLKPMQSFGGRPLTALIDPKRVQPETLMRLERDAGPALYTSHHWVQTEPLRLLALSGYRVATVPDRAGEIL